MKPNRFFEINKTDNPPVRLVEKQEETHIADG